jgi:hypothetical protein
LPLAEPVRSKAAEKNFSWALLWSESSVVVEL